MSKRYFGCYCSQCNTWIRKSDNTLLYYPSPELAHADLSTDLDMLGVHFYRPHLFVVTEFGKEQPVDREHPNDGETVCPVIIEQLDRQRNSQPLGCKDAMIS